MNVYVINSREALKYKLDSPHIYISICDPGDQHPRLPKNIARVATLQLKFHDVDNRGVFHGNAADQLVFMSEKQAKCVVEFVQKYRKKVNSIICQCNVGICRSPGMAAALAKCINGDDKAYFNCYAYVPNMLVYKRVIDAWCKNEVYSLV